MKTLEKNSKAVFELSLGWSASEVQHRDCLWADPVSIWRDWFTPEVTAALTGKTEGDTLTFSISADTSPFIFKKEKVVIIPPGQLHLPGKQEQVIDPVGGRFYPQGYLHGVSGVFQASVGPARFIGEDEKGLHFNLNHPLAGFDLELGVDIIKIHTGKTERGGRCEDWLEKIGLDGSGMQARYRNQSLAFLSPEGALRLDESEDSIFYQNPRMVQHLDSSALESISANYANLIRPDSKVLDLMGSWDSHLPAGLGLKNLTVLGLNPEELAANTEATETVVQDLNQDHNLTFETGSFDAVICTASVEYLTDPLQVFREVERVLRPGGIVAVAFSNRWFPPKAIAVWSQLHEFERLGMVIELLQRTPNLVDIGSLSRRGLPRPEDDPHWELPYSDPVFMVWGRKKENGS